LSSVQVGSVANFAETDMLDSEARKLKGKFELLASARLDVFNLY
jgi:hypothetical protein